MNKYDMVLYETKMIWGFKRGYNIFKNKEKIISIVPKRAYDTIDFDIVYEKEKLAFMGHLKMSEFQIYSNDQLVLSIEADIDDKYRRIIKVDEMRKEPLLMLMFTLLSAWNINTQRVR